MTIRAYWYRRSDVRPWLGIGRRERTGARNFGDEFSGDFITWWTGESVNRTLARSQRLIVGGSILHLLRATDVVLSVGAREPHRRVPKGLNVLGARGLLTRSELQRSGYAFDSSPFFLGDVGMFAPEVYGLGTSVGLLTQVIILPHFRHEASWRRIARERFPSARFVPPSASPADVARHIHRSGRIITSSLHGLIFGAAFGLDVIWVAPPTHEPLWKYRDFFSVFDGPCPEPRRDLLSAFDAPPTRVPALPGLMVQKSELPAWRDIVTHIR